jgi:hypothetical protein
MVAVLGPYEALPYYIHTYMYIAKELHACCHKPPYSNHGLFMVAYQKNIGEITDETGGTKQFCILL